MSASVDIYESVRIVWHDQIGDKQDMRMPKPAPKPTDGELEILGVLWERGPSTVREVHDALRDTRGVGYTTVLKLMQIMTEKGLVRRDQSQRSHVYTPCVGQVRVQRSLVKELLMKAFGGSAEQLIMQALAAGRVAPGELAEIRKVLDDLEREERP